MNQEKPNFNVLGISHIGIAAKNPEVFSQFLLDMLGLSLLGQETVASQKTHTQFISSQAESPTVTPDETDAHELPRLESLVASPAGEGPIHQFLEKKGGGIHHIALKVDSLANALSYLEGRGVKLIDKTPRIGAGGHLIAFIHPHATGGILIELCQHGSATP